MTSAEKECLSAPVFSINPPGPLSPPGPCGGLASRRMWRWLLVLRPRFWIKISHGLACVCLSERYVDFHLCICLKVCFLSCLLTPNCVDNAADEWPSLRQTDSTRRPRRQLHLHEPAQQGTRASTLHSRGVSRECKGAFPHPHSATLYHWR